MTDLDGGWTCPRCRLRVPVPLVAGVDRYGHPTIRTADNALVDVWAHYWTHEENK